MWYLTLMGAAGLPHFLPGDSLFIFQFAIRLLDHGTREPWANVC